MVCSLENFGQNNPKYGLMRIIGHFPRPGRYEVQVCDECGACRDVCPVEAILERNGHLEVDPELCTSCLACVEACPRGVMRTHRDWSSPHKCFQCGVCAEYCPTGAIYDADTVRPEEAWRIIRGAAAKAGDTAGDGGAHNG
jgi:ferredoxin